MKKRFFISLLLAIIASNLLANPTDTRRMIDLKVKKKMEHRSIIHPTTEAFITGSLLEIRFNSPFNEAIISVSDNNTGEKVCYKEIKNEEVIIIYLYGDNNETEYLLDIQIDDNTFINGKFSTK